eukprot:11053226-Lingulodinium_polyedra.AAC.1
MQGPPLTPLRHFPVCWKTGGCSSLATRALRGAWRVAPSPRAFTCTSARNGSIVRLPRPALRAGCL